MPDGSNDEDADQTEPDNPRYPEPDDSGPTDAAPLYDDDEAESDPAEPAYGSDEPDYSGRGSALPPRLEAWRKRSATGAILTGMALGLQQVFENKKDEPSITVQTSGDPPTDLPVEADFEFRRPRQSVVQIRPWLLEGQAPQENGEATENGENTEAPSAADVPAGGDEPADGSGSAEGDEAGPSGP